VIPNTFHQGTLTIGKGTIQLTSYLNPRKLGKFAAKTITKMPATAAVAAQDECLKYPCHNLPLIDFTFSFDVTQKCLVFIFMSMSSTAADVAGIFVT
jgi:hypothetical protein